MKNREIARMFSDIADMLEIKEDNRFKIRAYRKAALNLEGLARDVAELSHKELLEIPGVGEDLAAKIEEYLRTGAMTSHDKLKGEIPAGVLELLAVPDLGPKTAKSIYDTLRVTSIEELEQAAPASFGAALAYLTGSKEHNVRLREMALKRGLKINEYGIFREKDDVRLGGENEDDVYRTLGLPFIPPELREDAGEIEVALAGSLPHLITLSDIRGDLHVHSKWSDGAHTIAQVAEAARQRGLAYIAITDHSKGLGVARGLTVERLLEQGKEIKAFNLEKTGVRVLHGTEMEILEDGRLDFPDLVLEKLDIVIASVHSGFTHSRERMTARIVAAMRNPWVSIIAHPTGRLIGEREGYEVDMEELLRVARETGTALEINSYPLRLDLADKYVRRAKELGVALVINTDTHAKGQLDSLSFGISVARRGWLEKRDVLNTLEVSELLQRLGAKRRQAPTSC